VRRSIDRSQALFWAVSEARLIDIWIQYLDRQGTGKSFLPPPSSLPGHSAAETAPRVHFEKATFLPPTRGNMIWQAANICSVSPAGGTLGLGRLSPDARRGRDVLKGVCLSPGVGRTGGNRGLGGLDVLMDRRQSPCPHLTLEPCGEQRNMREG